MVNSRLLLLLLLQQQAFAVQLSAGVFETIKAGRVAVIPDYFRTLRNLMFPKIMLLKRRGGGGTAGEGRRDAVRGRILLFSPTRDVGLKDQVAAERSVLRGSVPGRRASSETAAAAPRPTTSSAT
jgi:hypothetical protein